MEDKDTEILGMTCFDIVIDEPVPDTSALPFGILQMVIENGKLWECGQVLDFHFLGGNKAQKAAFRDFALQWTQYANILMRFDSAKESSEARVNFRAIGNWSLVGRDNRDPKYFGKQTMNIQNMDSTLHEVGHLLGCTHEHFSPDGDIHWNKAAIYKSLAGPPNRWDKKKIDLNFFQKYSAETTQFTKYDPSSVMLYFYPDTWTTDGTGSTKNKNLSATDKAFIRRCYPGCTVDFTKPQVLTGGCALQLGPEVKFNDLQGNSWTMKQPGNSFIEVTLDQPKQYDGQDIYESAKLKLTHQAKKSGAQPGHSPIDIVVNGKVFIPDYSPPSGTYKDDTWDIKTMMQDGANTVRLNFKDATSVYSIQKLQIDCLRNFI